MRITESQLRKIIREEVKKSDAKQTLGAIKSDPSILVSMEKQIEKAFKDNPKLVDKIIKAAESKGITPEKAAKIASDVESSASVSESDEEQEESKVGNMLPAIGLIISTILNPMAVPAWIAAILGARALGWLANKAHNA
jgi:hypothetical protein